MTQKTILVVEDEALIALKQKEILERNGYAVRIAYNGASAVEIAAGSVVSAATGAANNSSPGDDGDPGSEDTPIDLILMDIDLGPGIDGTEAARRVLAHREIPIVFLSSHTEPEIVERTESISSYGYVVKHAGETVLIASIRMAFRLYEAYQHQRSTGAYLRAVVETIPNGFWVSDQYGRITDANQAYCEISGYSRSELLGMRISRIDINNGTPDFTARMDRLGQGGTERFYSRHRTKNGEEVPVSVTTTRIVGSDPPRFITMIQDRTGEDRASRTASDARDSFYTSLLEEVPGAVYQYRMYPDGTSRFPFASRGIEAVYEVTPEEVQEDATVVFRRLHPDDHDAVVASIAASMRSLEIWEHDYRVVLPERGDRWLRGRARPRKLEDDSVLWDGYITDITDMYCQRRETETLIRRLLNVIDGTNAGTWEWNVTTGETIFNDRWAEIFGYTIEELAPTTFETWTALVHPDDLPRTETALDAHFRGDCEHYQVEIRMRHKEGHWVWVLDRGKVMSHTESGEPEWVFGTHQEITDQVHARERLERSEANFRAFFDTSIDYLWVLDETGKILDVNASVTNNLGYTKDELLGRSVLEMHPPDRRDEAAEIVAAMIAGTQSSCPIPLLAGNGARVPVETYVMRATWNDAPAFFGISRDISALAFSEEKYAKMFDTSPAMVTLSEYDTGILVDVNEAFCRTLGFTRDEVIGHTSTEIIGLDPDFRMKAITEIETAGHADNLETTIITRGGNPLEVLLSAAVITVQDSRFTFTTAIDITERKRAERELERSVATERTLMAELNHRVKNNLAMVGSLLRLKDAELGDSADLGDIHARVEAITSLHEELQHAGGVGEVALDSYLGRVISNVVANSSTPVAVTLELRDLRIPTKIAVSLGLIINELATNAVKYGFNLIVPPELTVRESIRGHTCTITVTNSGNPFPVDIDLDNPTTMGLRLVSMLVKQISGTVALVPTPKTQFSITFPIPVV
ncbi:MAG: PAS domain S-box protein [Alkalispirochaeta sp.]